MPASWSEWSRDFLGRLFSGVPKAPAPDDAVRTAETARCRFFIEEVHRLDGGEVSLIGLMDRGRLYAGATVELVGYGVKATVRCRDVREGRQWMEYASPRTHPIRFLVGVEHDDPDAFRSGQVLTAPGTAHNVRACEADLEVTGTPGNLGRAMATGLAVDLRFRKATASAVVTLPDGRDEAAPGEAVTVGLALSEALPLEVGDEIGLGVLGSVFAQGRVTGVRIR